ncbi:NAD(P)-dependent oxidoreductase [Streptomyces sp. ICBB 8177]|uniref:NAD-dependent epimerase/dehydratase family protein n=1 Tax=Streptomyces sp. ICBB 8177 TaxID=563922 RepID=UPI000D67D746|nr:NAD(P)-dependent oxidoreductase [Streptomyces sp. ICBB 8177]PWI44800.1 epimerase [Streptomyces sp. ICBB 8177]
MVILVTGATGQVGSRFVPRLLGRVPDGGTVRVLVRDERRAEPFAARGAQVAVGELRDAATLRAALEGVDAVVNIAAAFRGVPDEEAWEVNARGAVALGRAAVEAGAARFVQVSTNLVYGLGRGRPHEEDDASQPGGPLWGAYPASKAEAERSLLALHRDRGLDVRIGRLAFVYGDGDPHLSQSTRLLQRWPGSRRLQMVHHADVAQGLLRLLFAEGIAGRAYNIADEAPCTLVELHQLNRVPAPDGLGAQPDDSPWTGIVSVERARRELGFRPVYPTVWTAREAGAL